VIHTKTVPELSYVLTCNCLLLLLQFGCTTNHRSIPFGYLLHLLVQGHQGLLCFLRLFTFYQGCWRTRKLLITPHS